MRTSADFYFFSSTRRHEPRYNRLAFQQMAHWRHTSAKYNISEERSMQVKDVVTSPKRKRYQLTKKKRILSRRLWENFQMELEMFIELAPR